LSTAIVKYQVFGLNVSHRLALEYLFQKAKGGPVAVLRNQEISEHPRDMPLIFELQQHGLVKIHEREYGYAVTMSQKSVEWLNENPPPTPTETEPSSPGIFDQVPATVTRKVVKNGRTVKKKFDLRSGRLFPLYVAEPKCIEDFIPIWIHEMAIAPPRDCKAIRLKMEAAIQLHGRRLNQEVYAKALAAITDFDASGQRKRLLVEPESTASCLVKPEKPLSRLESPESTTERDAPFADPPTANVEGVVERERAYRVQVPPTLRLSTTANALVSTEERPG